MDLIGRKISTKDVLRKMKYADHLATIAESKQELHEGLEEWKGVFKKHGLGMSLEKTEVMWVGHQREELNIRLDGKEIKQVDGFVYFGGMVTEDGHSVEVGRSAMFDTSVSECLEKGRGSHVGQKNVEKA